MKKETRNKVLTVTLYAIAMGFLEAVVVIYLRKLYYVSGFDFPLRGFIEPQIIGIEWIREFATIVMLATVGMLAGKKFNEKLAYFLYAFAIWDLFYYVSLKLTINWPSSFMTWDLLFLIPWPWVGPVLAPVICTALILVFSLLIIYFEDRGIHVKIIGKEWAFLLAGTAIVLYTWLYDYGKLIIGGGFAKDFLTLATNQDFYNVLVNYNPSSYNWTLFLVGIVVASLGIRAFYLRTRKVK